MTDDTQQRDWGDKVRDFVSRWTINIVQVIVALVVINVGMQAVWWYLDPVEYYDIFDHTWMSEMLSRCDSLEAELAADIKCRRDEACTMTRKEYAAYLERVDKYGLHCERE